MQKVFACPAWLTDFVCAASVLRLCCAFLQRVLRSGLHGRHKGASISLTVRSGIGAPTLTVIRLTRTRLGSLLWLLWGLYGRQQGASISLTVRSGIGAPTLTVIHSTRTRLESLLWLLWGLHGRHKRARNSLTVRSGIGAPTPKKPQEVVRTRTKSLHNTYNNIYKRIRAFMGLVMRPRKECGFRTATDFMRPRFKASMARSAQAKGAWRNIVYKYCNHLWLKRLLRLLLYFTLPCTVRCQGVFLSHRLRNDDSSDHFVALGVAAKRRLATNTPTCLLPSIALMSGPRIAWTRPCIYVALYLWSMLVVVHVSLEFSNVQHLNLFLFIAMVVYRRSGIYRRCR